MKFQLKKAFQNWTIYKKKKGSSLIPKLNYN